jgi:glucokinase
MEKYVLAIDLGGTHASCGLISGRNVLHSLTLPFQDTSRLAPLLPVLEHALHRLLSDFGLPPRAISGIGMGFCGLVDARSHRITSTNGKYIDAPDLDLEAWAQARFHLPLRIENDARMALLGECFAGAAQGETDVVMFTLGTGIGGVAMMHGRPLKGKHGQAGILGGHIPVRIGGRRCTCGGIGCAETEAAGWSLPLVAAEWKGFEKSALARGDINFKNLFACAESGDQVAWEIRQHCLDVWATLAVAAVHCFDPDLLLYGGGVLRSGDLILRHIREHLARYAWSPWGQVEVRAAMLDDKAPLLGAVPLLEDSYVR